MHKISTEVGAGSDLCHPMGDFLELQPVRSQPIDGASCQSHSPVLLAAMTVLVHAWDHG